MIWQRYVRYSIASGNVVIITEPRSEFSETITKNPALYWPNLIHFYVKQRVNPFPVEVLKVKVTNILKIVNFRVWWNNARFLNLLVKTKKMNGHSTEFYQLVQKLEWITTIMTNKINGDFIGFHQVSGGSKVRMNNIHFSTYMKASKRNALVKSL